LCMLYDNLRRDYGRWCKHVLTGNQYSDELYGD
jgi:hypothetical protein